MLDAALWTAALATLAAVLILSLGPEPPLESIELGDKIGHLGAYAALTVTFLLAAVWAPLRGAGRFRAAGRLIPPALVLLGALMELAQGLTARRSPEAGDALADLMGVVLGTGLWLLARGRGPRPRRPA